MKERPILVSGPLVVILPYHPSLVDPDTTGVPCSIFRGTSLPLQASKHPPEAPGKDAGIGALLTGTCSDPRVSAAADDRGVGGSKRPLDGEAEGSILSGAKHVLRR